MSALWREVRVEAQPGGLSASFVLVNRTRQTWSPETHFIAWQFFDPETNRFIMEGEWRPLAKHVGPGEAVKGGISVSFDPIPAGYRVYVSLLEADPEAMIEDKVMPALPLSVMNVMDGMRGTQEMTVLGESSVNEASTPVDYVVAGAQLITVNIK